MVLIMKNDKHYEYLPRTVRKNDSKKTVEIAEKILNDFFYESDFLDSFFMGEKYKNFSYIHSRAANSYQLYIHCLNVITFLCDAYVITKKTEYLDKAYNNFAPCTIIPFHS